MKLRVLGFVSVLAGSALFIIGCPGKNNLSSSNPIPTPTYTPAFNSCTPTAMLTPSPWSNTGPALVFPPSYTGTANIKEQIYDSTYTKVQDVTFNAVPSGTAFSILPKDKNGVNLNGNYYLEIEVLGTAPTTCYFEPFVVN